MNKYKHILLNITVILIIHNILLAPRLLKRTAIYISEPKKTPAPDNSTGVFKTDRYC